MSEPRWLTPTIVLAIHADQIRAHGGAHGLRDRNLLLSALERPRNRHRDASESDLFDLAAAYGRGIARDYPFVDGNKRVAFHAMYVFLRLNGARFEAPEEDVVATILSLAAGTVTEPELAAWLRDDKSAAR